LVRRPPNSLSLALNVLDFRATRRASMLFFFALN
jgi:hypothetical protein